MTGFKGAVALSRGFESALQTIISGGLYVIAHGLGVEPEGFEVVAECQTAEIGYSIGDRVPVQVFMGNGGNGCSIVPDATNLTIRLSNLASAFQANHKTTGVGTVMTNGNWLVLYRCYA